MENREFRLLLMQMRIGKNMTQTDLAEVLQVSQKSVSMWENGETVPRDPMKIKLAQVFGLPIDYFLNGNNSDNNNETKSADDANKTDKVMNTENKALEETVEMLLGKFGKEDIEAIISKLKTQ